MRPFRAKGGVVIARLDPAEAGIVGLLLDQLDQLLTADRGDVGDDPVLARLLVEPPGDGRSAPWSPAQLVVREVPGGLSADEVADVVGRPVLGELGTDRSAVSRGEQGRPPQVGARSPLGAVARRLLAELARVDGAAA